MDRHSGVRMLEGEVAKLLKMEDKLHARVVGKTKPFGRSRTPFDGAGRVFPIPIGPWGPSFFSGPRVWENRTGPGVGGVPFRRRARAGSVGYVGIHGKTRGGPPDRRAAGVRGVRRGGQLTEAVRRRPYAVLLAWTKLKRPMGTSLIFCLQILDDGRLTDGQGRTVDFKNTVVIMTSNIGSQWLTEAKTDRKPAPGDGGPAGPFPAGIFKPHRRNPDFFACRKKTLKKWWTSSWPWFKSGWPTEN
jgi:ATP-dependent Clp protease ATP-binding subunit ClpB